MAVQRQVGSQTDAKESAVDLTGKEFCFIARAADGRFTLPVLGGQAAGVCQEGKPAGRHTSIATGNQLKVLAGAVLAPGDKVSALANGQARVAAATHHVLGTVIAGAQIGELAEIDFDRQGILA